MNVVRKTVVSKTTIAALCVCAVQVVMPLSSLAQTPPPAQPPAATQPPYPSSPPPQRVNRPATAPATPAKADEARCTQLKGIEKAECERRDTTNDDAPAGVTSSMREKQRAQEEEQKKSAASSSADSDSDTAKNKPSSTASQSSSSSASSSMNAESRTKEPDKNPPTAEADTLGSKPRG